MRHVVSDITTVVTWICWAVVGVVWAAGAVLGRQERAAEEHDGRDVASLAGAGAGLLITAAPDAVWRPLTVGSPWFRVAGLPVLLAASAATVAARLALGPLWSSRAATTPDHALRTTGPYALSRHPIYAGILAMLVATAITQGLGRWAAVLGLVAVVLLVKIRAEERLLMRELPAEYERYRRQVPQLVPRLRHSSRRAKPA